MNSTIQHVTKQKIIMKLLELSDLLVTAQDKGIEGAEEIHNDLKYLANKKHKEFFGEHPILNESMI